MFKLGFDKFSNGIYSVNAAALLIGAASLLSRILGVLRDRILAAHFGAGRELDIYYTAFQVPDFMSVIFLLGAGSAAILPIFQEYLARDKKEAVDLISELSSIFITGSILFSLVIFIFVYPLIHIISPGFTVEEQMLTAVLTRIMLLSPILFGLSSIFSAVIQSCQRFWAYALAPVLYNMGIIIGILFFVPILGVKGLAFGVVMGAALHLGVSFLAVRDFGFSPKLIWFGVTEGIKKVLKLSFPRVLSISLSQVTVLVLMALGSTLAQGSIAVFNLAQNLYFVPIGLFGVSYSVVIFPRLSRAYIQKSGQEFFKELFWGIRSILFWILPSMVLFIVLRAHLVRVVLGAGAFSWEDTRLTAAVLAGLTIAMFSAALSPLFIKAFYALENTRRPLLINFFAFFLSVSLAFIWTKVLAVPSFWSKDVLWPLFKIADLPDSRVIGLALGLSIGSVVNIFLLYGALKRLAFNIFNEYYPPPLKAILKICIASLVGGMAAYIVRVSFSETLPLITFIRVLGQGIMAGLVGFGVYFGMLFFLGNEEIYSLGQTFRRKLFRVGILPSSWDGEINPSSHHPA